MTTVPHRQQPAAAADPETTAPAADSPPVADLLAHWRNVIERGESIAWGADRGAVILEYTAGLERTIGQLHGTIELNHALREAAIANLRAEVRALLRRLVEVDTADGIQAVYERLAATHTETT